jgi:hypothetical protein
MCDMCQPDGEMAGCPECGRLICWDIDYHDDIVAPAAATASGDLMCLPCAIRTDRQEEDDDPYPGPWDD